MIASSEEANTAVLRASLWRTASAAATPSTNSPISEPSASVSTSRSGSGSRSSRANSSITATHSPPARIGNASAPRSPAARAGSTRVNLSDSSTFANQAGSAALPDRRRAARSRGPSRAGGVASSNSGASKPGARPGGRSTRSARVAAHLPEVADVPAERLARSPRAGAAPADSSESASASTRATPYCTDSRAASRSRSERSRAMPTARPLTRPTAATPDQLVGRSRSRRWPGRAGSRRASANSATIAVWLGRGAERRHHRADQQQLDQHGALADGEVERRDGADRDQREQENPAPVAHSLPCGYASPTRTPDYFRASRLPIYNGANARFRPRSGRRRARSGRRTRRRSPSTAPTPTWSAPGWSTRARPTTSHLDGRAGGGGRRHRGGRADPRPRRPRRGRRPARRAGAPAGRGRERGAVPARSRRRGTRPTASAWSGASGVCFTRRHRARQRQRVHRAGRGLAVGVPGVAAAAARAARWRCCARATAPYVWDPAAQARRVHRPPSRPRAAPGGGARRRPAHARRAARLGLVGRARRSCATSPASRWPPTSRSWPRRAGCPEGVEGWA